MMPQTLTIYRVSLYCAVFVFLWTLFPLQTIVMFWVCLFLAKFYITAKISKLIENGLISYLPQKVQQQLLNRSLFDILCDFWFMQEISYLKIFVKPFFVPVQPDRAVEVLNELSPETKMKFLKKGMVNILPHKLKKLLIPTNRNQISEQLIIQPILQIQAQSPKKRYVMVSSDTGSTDQNKQNKEKSKKSRPPPINRMYAQQEIFNEQPKIQKQLVIQEAINNEQVQKWDRLQLYKKLRNNFNSGEGIINIAKRNIQILKRFMVLSKFSVHNISYQSLLKLMMFFGLLILIQLKYANKNKQTLKLVLHIINIFISVTSVLGVAGASGLMGYKIYQSVVSKNKQKMERLLNGESNVLN